MPLDLALSSSAWEKSQVKSANSLEENRENEAPLIVPRNMGPDRLQIISLGPHIKRTYTLQNILETYGLNLEESGGTFRGLCSWMYTTF
jgi:hypothetical protein